MEMTIDEAIKHLGNYSSTNGSGLTTDKQHNEAKRVAIETMLKYQQIEQIVKSKTTRVSYDIGFEQIKKVVEDGKID